MYPRGLLYSSKSIQWIDPLEEKSERERREG